MKQHELVEKLGRYAEGRIDFKPGASYYWSPKGSTVFYQKDDNTVVGQWTLLHEVSHGLLHHAVYESDFELVLLEMRAWEKAKRLGSEFRINIDDDHVQDCLDSYRDWQYKRSLCPSCSLGGIQISPTTYQCLFCDGNWQVSSSRFCRPYRRKLDPPALEIPAIQKEPAG